MTSSLMAAGGWWAVMLLVAGCGGSEGSPASTPPAATGTTPVASVSPPSGPPAQTSAPNARHCPKPTAEPCSKDGWCWDHPKPHGMRFEGAWGDDRRLVAFGGRSIVAVREQGSSRWQYLDAGTTSGLEAIYGAGDSVYLSGRRGTLVRFVDGCFEPIDVGSSDDFFGVWTDGDVVMVTGQEGRIHVFRGGAWSKLEVPEKPRLFSIFARSADDVIVADGNGTLYRHERGTWSSASQSDRWFHAIHGSKSGPIYAAGSASNLAELDPSRTGSGWRGLDRGVKGDFEDWYGVWSSGPTRAVAVGSLRGGIATLAGDPLPALENVMEPSWHAVSGTSTGDITVLGTHVARYDAKTKQWAVEHDPSGSRVYLEGIGGKDDDHVFAVGWEGTILQRDGTRGWKVVRSTGNRSDYLRDVWVRRPDHVWVVGSNKNLLEWDGKIWHQRATSETPHLNAIWSHDDDLAYAVGGGARLSGPSVMRSDGKTWTLVQDAPAGYWFDVWGSGPSDVYLTGHKGVAHFDGKAWRLVEEAREAFPEPQRKTHFNAQHVWGSGPKDVFVTLSNGGVVHFDGTSWRYTPPEQTHLKYSLPNDGGPDEIFGARSDAVGSVSNHGLIYRFDGKTWLHETSASSTQFANVWANDEAVYAVGGGGTILRRALR